MSRQATITAIEEAIGHRHLLWVGTRGTDAAPLLGIDQFEGVVGLVAPLGVPSWPDGAEEYLERLAGYRVDLNSYAIDDDDSAERAMLLERLRAMLTPGSLVLAYRPTGFLASAYYPRMEHATFLGMFHGHQSAYDHKPWVETELAARGVPTIPWRYFSDADRQVMREWIDGRRCVLRANYSDGGIGLTIFEGSAPFIDPPHDGGFLAVAPLLEPNVPLNVSGCVFPSGLVTVKSPSLQLIGISSCTSRRFGYCGNDFAATHDVLGDDLLDELERMVRMIGAWLYERGYVGAFGIDALLYGGSIVLTEVNPRFQGSSAASASILADAGVPDIYLDHLSAMLGLEPAADQPTLKEQAALQAEPARRLAQVVCYNTGDARMRSSAIVPDLDYGDLKGAPDDGILVLPEAMLFKLFVRDSVTATGFDLPAWLDADVRRLTSSLFEPTAEGEDVA